jgi:hypothetical protein
MLFYKIINSLYLQLLFCYVVAGYEPEFLQTVRHQVQRPSVGGRGPVQHRDVLPRVLGVHRRGTQERR